MDALLFALVLEVSLLQVRIQEGSTELRSRYWKCSTKFEKAQRNKLAADRDLLREVFRLSLIEVGEVGQWGPILGAVQALEERFHAAVALRRTHERLRQSRNAVTEDLDSMRRRWARELYTADHEIAYLRDKLKDDLLNASTRLRYADRWLAARAEALELRCRWRAAPAPRPWRERRVHDELVKAFQLQTEERERALEYWRVRYSDDTADINKRLADVRDQYVAAISRREKLQSLHEQRAGEMRGWLAFKRERAARRAREQRQHAAATLLQAWWRGLMVRRALGQYRSLRSAKKPPAKKKK